MRISMLSKMLYDMHGVEFIRFVLVTTIFRLKLFRKHVVAEIMRNNQAYECEELEKSSSDSSLSKEVNPFLYTPIRDYHA